MKNILLALLMLFTLACSGNSEKSGESTDSTTTLTAAKTYACPMQCEGSKTYAEAGKCPVCKMDLQEVSMAETDSTAHNH